MIYDRQVRLDNGGKIARNLVISTEPELHLENEDTNTSYLIALFRDFDSYMVWMKSNFKRSGFLLPQEMKYLPEHMNEGSYHFSLYKQPKDYIRTQPDESVREKNNFKEFSRNYELSQVFTLRFTVVWPI